MQDCKDALAAIRNEAVREEVSCEGKCEILASYREI
jgi:hypothetical protein